MLEPGNMFPMPIIPSTLSAERARSQVPADLESSVKTFSLNRQRHG